MYTLIWKISEDLLLQNVKSISKGFKKANVNIQCRFANGWTLICSIMMVMSAQRVPGIPCMFLAPWSAMGTYQIPGSNLSFITSGSPNRCPGRQK